MRIALVILHADRTRGGAETYTLDLAHALVRRGHDVSLLASTFAQPNPGVTEVALDASAMMRAGRYQHFLDALDAHVSSTPYDIVHAMLPVRQCDVYHPHAGIAAAEMNKVSALFNPRRRAMARVERRLLSRDDGPTVLCLSEYVKTFVRTYYPLPDTRLVKLFNAVDLERFDPRSTGASLVSDAPRDESPRDGITINALIIAQDFERKGLRHAIEAVARVHDPRLRLTVVGKDNPDPFAKLARSLKVEQQIHFAGPTRDTVPFYQSADFFVLPTHHDPCSLVVLEALAMGLPVVSTRFNGATEIMTEGVHGYVLPDPADVESLADRMKRLLDDALRQTLREACLQLRPMLSYEHHLDQLEAIYAARNSRIGSS